MRGAAATSPSCAGSGVLLQAGPSPQGTVPGAKELAPPGLGCASQVTATSAARNKQLFLDL